MCWSYSNGTSPVLSPLLRSRFSALCLRSRFSLSISLKKQDLKKIEKRRKKRDMFRGLLLGGAGLTNLTINPKQSISWAFIDHLMGFSNAHQCKWALLQLQDVEIGLRATIQQNVVIKHPLGSLPQHFLLKLVCDERLGSSDTPLMVAASWFGDGPDDQLPLESNGDYTRALGHLHFADFNNNTENEGPPNNLLNSVWYQPEEVFPIDGTPEVSYHTFWIPVNRHYFDVSKKLKASNLNPFCT